MKTRSRGFTLIELLTVIAIIGILAAILIPTVGKVRDSAKRAKCMSNVRQIAVALINSANQHRRQEFPSNAGAEGRWGWDVQHTVIKDLVNQAGRNVLYCPSSKMLDENPIDDMFKYPNNSPTSVFAVTGYVLLIQGTSQIFPKDLNKSIQSSYDVATTNAPGSPTESVPASRRPLVVDAVISGGIADSAFANVGGGLPVNVSNHMAGSMPSGGHTGYVDGHVAWRKFVKSTSTDKTGYTYRNNGDDPKFWF